jgi:hypothetical protein
MEVEEEGGIELSGRIDFMLSFLHFLLTFASRKDGRSLRHDDCE